MITKVRPLNLKITVRETSKMITKVRPLNLKITVRDINNDNESKAPKPRLTSWSHQSKAVGLGGSPGTPPCYLWGFSKFRVYGLGFKVLGSGLQNIVAMQP